MTYSGIFRTADIFSQCQTLLKINSCIFWTLFEQINTYLELWLIQARSISRIFRHIQKVTHIGTYLPTLGFRIFAPISTLTKLAHHPHHARKHATHATHASTSATLAYHPHKHAVHATHANTPPTQARHSRKHVATQLTLARIARHFSNSWNVIDVANYISSSLGSRKFEEIQIFNLCSKATYSLVN